MSPYPAIFLAYVADEKNISPIDQSTSTVMSRQKHRFCVFGAPWRFLIASMMDEAFRFFDEQAKINTRC